MRDRSEPDDCGTAVVLADGCREVVLGRVDATVEPLVLFEAVARLHLAARREGYAVRIVTRDPTLVALFELVGLAELAVLVKPP